MTACRRRRLVWPLSSNFKDFQGVNMLRQTTGRLYLDFDIKYEGRGFETSVCLQT